MLNWDRDAGRTEYRAKFTGQRRAFRVEVRRQFRMADMLMSVYPTGRVQLSFNGKADMTTTDLMEITAACGEALRDVRLEYDRLTQRT